MADGIPAPPRLVDLLLAQQRLTLEGARAARAEAWRQWVNADVKVTELECDLALLRERRDGVTGG